MLSCFFLINVILLSCRSCESKLKNNSKIMEDRFDSNIIFFWKLKDSACSYAIKEKKISDWIYLNDVIKDSLNKIQFISFNIEKLIVFKSTKNRLGIDIYFKDINCPILYVSFKPGLDTIGGIGRHPIRKVLWQNIQTKDSWIIREYFD